MSQAKAAFNLADLQGGAKGLKNVEKPAEDKKAGGVSEEEEAARRRLEDIYEKHNGDLDLIFSELNENPEKAKKPHNRPKSAGEFARKFLAGFYFLIADEKTDNAEPKDAK